MLAQFDFAPRERVTASLTGDENRERQLYYQLQKSMKAALEIDFIVSFLMESGVRLLLDDLKSALGRGAKIRILTGNYLGITQPTALYLLKYNLGEQVDLRFYSDKSRSFHPKAYIFHYGKNKGDEIFIGSSNLSKSALTSGIEWNYRLQEEREPQGYRDFFLTFSDLFENHSLIVDDAELERYAKSWHKPVPLRLLENAAAQNEREVTPLFQPRGAQIEALYALRQNRAEGARRALVQAATGIGKTYLAAFDSKEYKHILFVAHREEILRQAAKSFYNVRHDKNYGFFAGQRKDLQKNLLFASVATLGQEKYLREEFYPPDFFDYIVIDEFHHAVNTGYKNILNYFQPRFVLGLTATPERLDGQNIYEICDYNVPYEISLYEAINKGLLTPFHYYGIYDETDYGDLHLVNGQYTGKQLNAKYLDNKKRADLIIKHYQKYHSQRALGFCATQEHACKMAEFFSQSDIPSAAVCSNKVSGYTLGRDAALKKLEAGEIKVIFAVDIFNEGVDIPRLDMVMFLRPTQSPTIFLQQLGRGLRRAEKKKFLNVLDFIGNYEKAGLIIGYLTRQNGALGRGYNPSQETEYPDDCEVDFDIRLIDLFERLSKQKVKLQEKIKEEFLRVKALIGHVPSRVELFTYMEDSIYELCRKNHRENPFSHYLSYLAQQGLLDKAEQKLFSSIAREFISEVENTNMVRIYKMPILYAFYNDGNVRLSITEGQALTAWKKFFAHGINWKDLSLVKSYAELQHVSDKRHLSLIKKMPVEHLKGGQMFVEKEGFLLSIREEIAPFLTNEALKRHFADTLEYRTLDYYKRRYMSKKEF